MQIFNFIVFSVIISHRSVLFPHVRKSHLPISLTIVETQPHAGYFAFANGFKSKLKGTLIRI